MLQWIRKLGHDSARSQTVSRNTKRITHDEMLWEHERRKAAEIRAQQNQAYRYFWG